METRVILASSPRAFSDALEILISGGLVAFPTDTVYGLGALVYDGLAVKRIFAAKERWVEKSIPVLIGDLDDLVKVSLAIPETAVRLASAFWPGPLTLILPKQPDLPEALSASQTIGVRLPDHVIARSLLRLTGPMAVTSANLSGRESPSTADEVLEQLGGRIDLILDGGRTPGGVPSTVVNCVGEGWEILREGPITRDDILSTLDK